MTKRPYTFPHRSRSAMVAYLLDRKSYHDHSNTFPFSWNVKVYSLYYDNPTGRTNYLDAQWAEHVQNSEVVEWAYESARDQYAEDWSSYPGDDQGDWRFGFYGRSAGHLCLERWRGHDLCKRDFDLQNWLHDELSTDDLRAFYRGIRCADSDFTQAKAAQEVEHHLAFYREQWEEERNTELENQARDMEDSRPDMHQAT